MEMSRITNSNPPKRGEQLTSTELNQVFTEANAAFPMDGDNVRNEGIEQVVRLFLRIQRQMFHMMHQQQYIPGTLHKHLIVERLFVYIGSLKILLQVQQQLLL
jgi:translation elongation factor P/translation initiation factor 5A